MDGSTQYDHSTIEALNHPHRQRAAEIVHHAREVVAQLEYYGPGIVPHLLDTVDDAGQRLRAALGADDHNATDVRPVVPVVARVLDIDELERFAAAGDRLPPADVLPLIAELRRLRHERDALLDRLSDRTAGKWSAEDERDQLRLELDADRKAIGVLGAAVGKVNALHQPDGDGFCRACRTVESPCPTAVALGVGQ